MIKKLKKIIKNRIYLFLDNYFKNKEHQEMTEVKNKFLKIGKASKLPKYHRLKNPQYISIGDNFFSLHNLRLEAWDEFQGENFTPKIIIGDNVTFNSDVHIGAIDKVLIGNNVLLASRIYISDHTHGLTDSDSLQHIPSKRKLVSKGPVIIEDNVWIGEGVCVLPGVTIGENSIVGANAVVNRSFPPNSIIGGIPAKLLKTIN